MNPLALILALLVAATAAAQQGAPPELGGLYHFGTIVAPGVLGKPVNTSDGLGAAITYTLQWNVDGTAPTACTFYPQGSLDGTHWFSLATASSLTTDPLDCRTASMVHFSFKPVMLFRVMVMTYTAGDPTTAISILYQRGTR